MLSRNSIKKKFLYPYCLLILIYFYPLVLGISSEDCFLNTKASQEVKKLLNRISPLLGKTFHIEKQGFTYSFGICVDTSKAYGNISVIRTKGNDNLALGRRNETRISGGDAWVMLRYECNKCPNSKENQCLGNRTASLYMICDPVSHEDFIMQLAEEDDCHFKFVLPNIIFCDHEEGISGSTIFFILISIAVFMYLIVGIIYRRLVHGAQGCQQLPHFGFWQKIGALLSDGCNYLCRCDDQPKFSWSNETNYDSTDRDDALLKP